MRKTVISGILRMIVLCAVLWCANIANAQSFAVATGTATIASSTQHIAWGDYDGDADLDLLVANSGGESNKVYQKGAGSVYALVWTSTETEESYAAAWGDYDGDGDLDHIVVNYGQADRVYRNNGGGNFASVWTTAETDSGTSISLADYDRDGDLDFAVGNYGQKTNIYRNNGAGSFQKTWSSSQAASTYSVEWADYNIDGKPDLLVGNNGANRIYRNEGSGVFSLAWTSAETEQTRSVAWGDCDADGDMDFICANSGAVANRVYQNAGGGSSNFYSSWTSAETDDTYSTGWADYDGDGDMDHIAGNNGQAMRVYGNTSCSNFSLDWSAPAASSTYSVAWGDYDGDFDMDIAAGNFGASNTVYVNSAAIGNAAPSAPTLTAEPDGASGYYKLQWTLGAADDKTPDAMLSFQMRIGTCTTCDDIMSGKFMPPFGNVGSVASYTVYLDTAATYYWSVAAVDTTGFATSTWAAEDSFVVTQPAFTSVWVQSGAVDNTFDVDVGDSDGDGDMDLLVGNNGFNYIFENTGDGTFALAWTSPLSEYTVGNAWGDMDGDGDLDFADGNFAQNNKVYRNDGNNSFSTRWTQTSAANQTRGVALGDLDNDGDLDIAFADGDQDNEIWENDGTGLFTFLAVETSNNYRGGAVAWGDCNGDGYLDLAIANYTTAVNNRLLTNDGDKTFTGVDFPNPSETSGSADWADFDGDGDVDLVVGNNNTAKSIDVFQNGGTCDFTRRAASGNYTIEEALWGDYDGDGDFDIITAREGANANIIIRFDGGTTYAVGFTSTETEDSQGLGVGDIDGDGDLDFFIGNQGAANRVYFNNDNTVNYPPTVPALVAEPDAWAAPTSNTKNITLNWAASTDDLSVAVRIGYNFRIGTTSGGADIVDGSAFEYPGKPGAGLTSFNLDLASNTTYYWAVQAIDPTDMSKGEWSDEDIFRVYEGATPTVINSVVGDATWRSASGTVYDVDFNDTGGSFLSYAKYSIWSGAGQTGTNLVSWATISENINSNSYTNDWGFDFAAATSGYNYFSVLAFDNAFNSTESVDVFYVLKDSTAPVVIDNQADVLTWQTASGTVYDVDFQDDDGLLENVQYTVWTGALFTGFEVITWSDIATGINATTYTNDWGFDFAAATSGQIYFSARAFDKAGNVSLVATDAFFIRIDATGPLPIVNFTGDDTWRAASGTLYDVDWVDNTSLVERVYYSIWSGAAFTGTELKSWATISANISAPTFTTDWGFDWPAATSGYNFFSLRSYDGLGNEYVATDAFYVLKDATAPFVTDLQPGDDTWRAASGTTYNVDFGDDDGLLEKAQYTLWSGAGFSGTELKNWATIAASIDATSYTNDWGFDWAAATSGQNFFSVRAYDKAGNVSLVSTDAFYVYKDATAPYVTNSVVGDDTWRAASGTTYNVDFNDDDGLLSKAQYTIWSGGAFSGTELKPWATIAANIDAASYTNDWGFDFAAATSGQNFFSVRAYDKAGNVSLVSTDAFYVYKDATAPYVTNNMVGDDTWRTASGTTYDVDFYDADGLLSKVQYTVWSGGVFSGTELISWATIAANIDATSYTNDWGFDFAAATSGQNFFSVRAFDKAGNVSLVSTDAFYVYKDSTAPVVVDTQGGDDTWRTADPGAIYEIDFTDNGELDRVQYTMYTGPGKTGTMLLNWATIAATISASSYTANWGIDFTAATSGYNYVSVRAYDEAGNATESQDVFYVLRDASAPAVVDNQAGSGTWYNADPGNVFDVDFTDTGTSKLDKAQYSVWTGAGQTGTNIITWATIAATINSDSYTANWGIDFTAATSGYNYVSVRAYDVAGNSTQSIDVFYVLKDATASVVINNMTGDNTWRTSDPGAIYDVDFSDADGLLDYAHYAIWSGAGQTGTNLVTWATIAQNINATTYSANWALDYAAATSGYNYISVRAFDKAGNATNSVDVFYLLKDATAPTVIDNQGGDSNWRSADPGPIYDVDFSDTSGSKLSRADYALWTGANKTGTNLLSWATIAASINADTYTADWGIDFTAATSGYNYVTVRSLDVAGNSTESVDVFYVLKDATAPVVSDNQSGSGTWYSADPGAVFDVDFSDVDGLLDYATYSIWSGAGKTGDEIIPWATIAQNIAANSYTSNWGIDFSAATSGYNFVSVKAADSAGTFTETQDVFFVLKDATAPVVIDTQGGDTVWRNADPGAIFEVDFSDADGLLDYVQYSMWTGANKTGVQLVSWATVAQLINATSYTANWGVDFNAATSGYNYVTVRAFDKAGNATESVDVFYLLRDASAPAVVDNQSGSGTWYNADPGAVFDVDFTDTGTSLLSKAQYSIWTGANKTGTELVSWATIAATINANSYTTDWGVDFAAATSGYNFVSVRAYDNTGNSTESVDVFFVLKDATAPEVIDTQGGDTTWHASDPGAIYEVDFADADGLLDYVQYSMWTGAAKAGTELVSWATVAQLISATSYTTNWGIDFSAATSGYNYVTVRSFDKAGNSTEAQDVFYVLKDATAPYVTDNQSGDNTWHNSDPGAIYDVDFDDDDGLLDNVQYTLWNASGMSTGTGSEVLVWTDIASGIALNTYNGNWGISFGSAADGLNFVSVRAYDMAGNISSVATDVFYFRKDITQPGISSRETYDLDADGYLDAVKITFTDNILDSSVTATEFDVQGVAGESFTWNTNGDTANDNVIYITFTPAGVWNTGDLPTVQFIWASLTDKAGNQLPSDGGAIATTDKAPPRIWAVNTMDDDGDASIDLMKVTLSEAITDADFNAASWTVSNTSAINGLRTGGAVLSEADVANDAVIYIDITASTTNDTDLLTQVYDTTVSGGALQDAAGNTIADCASGDVTETDGAPPAVISTFTADAEPDGFLNTVTFTFSESVTGSGETADWTLADVDGISNLMDGVVNGDISVAGANVTITLGNATGTTGAPTYTYTQAGGDDISDLATAPVKLLAIGATAMTDTAKPVIRAISTMDDNNDGAIDLMKVMLSEAVTDAAFAPASWTVSNTSAINGLRTGGGVTSEADAPDDAVIYIDITPDVTDDTDLITQVYDTTVSYGALADAAANTIADCNSGCVTETDGAQPSVIGTSIEDTEPNGYLNTASIRFSEALVGTGETADWTVLDGNGVADLMAGASVGIAGATVTITFTNATGTTGAPTFTYTLAGGDDIADTAGNKALATGATPIPDTAAPVIWAVYSSKQTAGANLQSGTVFTITFSEDVNIAGGSIAETDFSVTSGSWHGGATVVYADSATQTITATLSSNSTTSDWFGAPTLDRSAGALNVANSIEDAAGNDAVANGSTNPVIGGITDTVKPSITAILTLDDDADGKIDAIKVTLSEPVDDSTFINANGWSIDSGLAFTGSLLSPVTSEADAADDNTIYIEITEAGFNTDLVPNVTTDAAVALTDYGGGNTLATTTAIVETDGAKPAVIAAATLDDDGDGTVDHIRVTLSEAVVDAGFVAGNWSVSDTASVNGIDTGGAVLTEADVANDDVIYIDITASTSNDTDLLTQVYDTTVSGGALQDAAGNTIADCASGDVTETDGAPPAVITTATADSEPNGFLNTVTLVFSEALAGSGEVADWTVTDEDGTSNLLIASADIDVSINNASVTITFGDATGTTGPPSFTYTQQGGDDIEDISGNKTVNILSTAITDTAKPVIRAIITMDDNNDGAIDLMKVMLSEAVTDAAFAPASWTVSDTSAINGLRTGGGVTSEADAPNDAVIYIDITANVANDTDIIGEVYDTTVSFGALQDAAGNTIADCNSGCVAETDGAQPSIIDSYITDTEPDGYLDTVSFVFSEAITGSGEIADWTLIDENGSSNLMTNVLNGDISISGATLTIVLDNATGTTGSPSYTYTQAGLDNVRDMSNNAVWNIVAGTATDTASPVIIAVASSKQMAGGGLQDGAVLTITFSEDVAVAGAQVTAADFAVTGGNWHGGSTVTYADGATQTMTATLSGNTDSSWSNTARFDRALTPLTNLNSIEDSAGNDAVANGSVDPAVTGLNDTVRPYITAISTLDDDGDGRIDSLKVTISENVDDSSFTNANGWIEASLGFTGSLLSPTSETDIVDDNIIYVGITEAGYNTGYIPDVTTDNTVVLTDLGSSNTLASTTVLVETDGARPAMYQAEILDDNSDGSIDLIKVSLSEAVDDSTFDAASWTVTNTISVNGLATDTAVLSQTDTVDDDVIYISITPSTQKDTDLLVETYDTTMSASFLADLAGNTITDCNSGCVTEMDSAPPAVIRTYTEDTEYDGFMNKVEFAFSEALVGSGETADWTLLDEDSVTNLMTGASVGLSGATVTITLTNNIGTTGPLTYTYTQAGGDDIEDVSGNKVLDITARAASDTVRPVIVSAVIIDDNFDGTLDMVKVTLTEPVTDAAFGSSSWAITDTVSVDGLATGAAVTSMVDTVNDEVIYVRFTPTTASDTDLLGQVYDVTVTSSSLSDIAGNTVVNCNSGCVTEQDGASPVVKSVSTMDNDWDGTIDTMKVVLTEAVTDADFDLSAWTVSDTGAITGLRTGAAVIAETDTANDGTIYIKINAIASEDTDLVGEVYDTTVTGGSLQDAVGNLIIDLTSGGLVETDGAPPALISADTSAGTDTVTIRYTENVYNSIGAPASPGGDLVASDMSYTDWLSTGKTIVSFNAPAGTATGTMKLSSVLNSVSDIGMDFVSPQANSVFDDAGNASSIFASATFSDSSEPYILQVYEFDGDGDGNIDELIVRFSEYIKDSTVSNADGALFTIEGFNCVGVDNVTDSVAGSNPVNTIDPGSVNDNYITVFTDDTSSTGSDIKEVQFTMSAGRFMDFGNNEMLSQTDINETDATPPAYKYSVMQDTDENGYVDTIIVYFSETIVDPATDTQAWWTISNAPSAATVNQIVYNATSSMRVDLNEGTGAADTSVGLLKISYNSGNSSVRDAGGNAAVSVVNAVPLDDARPVMTAAKTGDADIDGYVDRVSITFSENVSVVPGNGLLDVGDMTNTLTGETYVSGSNSSTLVFSVTNQEQLLSWDTDEVPAAINYDRNGGGTIDIQDVSSRTNEARIQSFAGATDSAKPAIVAAYTGEATGTENGYIDYVRLRYSEPVAITTGTRNEYTLSGTTNTLSNPQCAAGGCGSGTEMIVISFTNSAGAYDTEELPDIAFTSPGGVVYDLSPGANDAASQAFTATEDRAGPWYQTLTLRDTDSLSTGYTNSQIIDVTMSNVTGDPVQMILAQTPDFASNTTGWVAFASSTTYDFTAGDDTRPLYLKLKDATGNEGAYKNKSIILDETYPVLAVTAPNGGEKLPARTPKTYPVTWTVSDLNLKPNAISIYYSIDNGTTFMQAAAGSLNLPPTPATYTWALPNYPSLTYASSVVQIRAVDQAGNITIDDSDSTFILDGNVPAVVFTSPQNGDEWAGGGSYNIQWTVSDNDIGTTPMTLKYSLDGGSTYSNIAVGLGPGTARATDPQVFDGNYTWSAINTLNYDVRLYIEAVDESGNDDFDEKTIVIDNIAPDKGTIVIVDNSTSVVDNSGYTNDITPLLTIETRDDVSATSMTSGDWMRLACTSGGLTAASWIAYATSVTTFDITTGSGCSTTNGNKSVYVQFKDKAGNVQSSPYANDATFLEKPGTDTDSIASLSAYTDSTMAVPLDLPPDYGQVTLPYFTWSAPVPDGGDAPIAGYVTAIKRKGAGSTLAAASATLELINATATNKTFTVSEVGDALRDASQNGTAGELRVFVRSVDKAGNYGELVLLDVNLDDGPPSKPEVIVANAEYLDTSAATPTYWVKPSNSFTISARWSELASLDKIYISLDHDEADNMELFHDWNNNATVYTETTTGAVFMSPVAGAETEGTGNGAAVPVPSTAGYFKYTWTMNPLNTNTNYYLRTKAIDQLGNLSDWTGDMAYVNIDATIPSFALTTALTSVTTTPVTVNDQGIFTNDTTPTFMGTLSDGQSGIKRVDFKCESGSDCGGALAGTWVAVIYNQGTWTYTTAAMGGGRNRLRMRGMDNVYNVSDSTTGSIGDVQMYVDVNPPEAMSTFTATATAGLDAVLTWALPNDRGSGTGAVSGSTEFFDPAQSWYRVGNVGIQVVRKLVSTGATTTVSSWLAGMTFTDTGLMPDTNYEYQFYARDNNNQARGVWYNSTLSATAAVSTPANQVFVDSTLAAFDPAPPSGTGKGHHIEVTIDPNGNVPPTTFEITMSSVAAATSAVVLTTDTTYRFVALETLTQYCFTVVAINDLGVRTVASPSVCEDTIYIDDNDAPVFAGVQSVTDTQTGSALDVSWAAATDETPPITYLIFMSTISGGQNFAGSSHQTTNTSYRVTTLNNGAPLVNGITYYVVVHARDNSVGKNVATNTVELSGTPTLDNTPPPLDLDPSGAAVAIDGLVTGASMVTVSGVTEAGAVVNIINVEGGTTLTPSVSGAGLFSTDVVLISQTNTIRVEARDYATNLTAATATVYYDSIAPAVSITYPAAGGNVFGNSISVTGSVSDEKQFSNYIVEYGPGASPTGWRQIGSGTSAVNSSTLTTWDTSEKSNVYTIRVTATDAAGNVGVGTVTFNLSNTTTISGTIPTGGWTMMAIPGEPLSANPASFLGSGNYAIRKWDPTMLTEDPINAKYLLEFSVGVADGFWVRPFGTAINYNLTLEVTDTTAEKTVSLENGWNQIGVPYNREMLWGDVRVKNPATNGTESMSQAASSGSIVGGVAYKYVNNGYQQLGEADRLQPGVGYFVKCGDSTAMPAGCDLLFNPGSERPGGIARMIRQPDYDLKFQIVARASGVVDIDNFIGVVSNARTEYDGQDSPEPPTISPYISVYFPKPDWKRNAGRFTNDVRGIFEGVETWEFAVDTDMPGEEVTLQFPGMGTLPAGYSVVIEDLDTGYRVDAARDHVFMAGTSERLFKVTLTREVAELTTVSHTVQPGWNLIATPVDPEVTDARSHLAGRFTKLNMFQFYDREWYDPESEQQVDIQAGVGYWLYSEEEKEIDIRGRTIPVSREIRLPMAQGWNLIGNPYTIEIPWGDNIGIFFAGRTYSLAEAKTEGLIDSRLFRYDEGNGYSVEESAVMETWRGYMIFVHTKCELVITGGQGE